MSGKLSRTMYYRRAEWASDYPQRDLQAVLEHWHQEKSSTSERTYSYLDGHKICGVDFVQAKSAFCGRVVRYLPGQHTSVLQVPSRGISTIVPEQFAPPEDEEFLRGDLFYVVKGNHLVFCATDSSESSLLHYFENLIDMQQSDHSILSILKLSPVIPIPAHKAILGGVKKIVLRSTFKSSTGQRLDQLTKKSTMQGLMSRISEYVAGWTEAPLSSTGDDGIDEELSLKLVISMDGRSTRAKEGYDYLTRWVAPLTEDESEDVVIVTSGGLTYMPGQLKIQQAVKITASGATTDLRETWGTLREYLDFLEETGELST